MGKEFQLVLHDAKSSVVHSFDQALVRLGYSSVCEFPFDKRRGVARMHAQIVRDGGGWSIEVRSNVGVAVNGQRVVRQRLRHGDRIVLAPDAVEPILLEFRSTEFSDSGPPQAILSEESGAASVVASIDLCELSKTLGQSGRGKRPAIELHPSNTTGRILALPDAFGRSLLESTSQLPVLSMFKSVGEILLTHETLDEMLQQVVNLIAEHLPGRRGAVCMVDQ
ncbi:MAG: FHA domain-containing protein, partial [Planctomycetota bacterium]